MTRLRIATFNVESLGDRSKQAAPLPERIAILRPQLVRLAADILCLQEVDAQDLPGNGGRVLSALDALLEGTPYAGYARAASYSRHGDYPADRHNLVILSRHPLAATTQLRHDLVPPLRYVPASGGAMAEAIDTRFDRPVLHGAVDLPGGRRLHILNLHLKAPTAVAIPGQKRSATVWGTTQGWAEGYFLAAMKRAGQALEARLLVDRILDGEPAAWIAVCGDFNAESWEVPVRLLLGAPDDTGNSDLAGRALLPIEAQLPGDRRYSVVHAGRRVMLDHILATPALLARLRDVEIHNERLSDEVFSHPEARRPAESFHAPLCAEFALDGGEFR